MKENLDLVMSYYETLPEKVKKARTVLGRPLTLTEKILFAHLFDEQKMRNYARGIEYADFRPDRVAMQDATAQMALLQFMNSGRRQSAVPATVHCDHLIQAWKGAAEDLGKACVTNREVYDFLQSVSDKFGIGFWSGDYPPGGVGKLCFSRRNDGGNRFAYSECGRIGYDRHRRGGSRCGGCHDGYGMGTEDA